MDHYKFVDIVQQYPQVWDRNNAEFREKNLKNKAWEQIANIMSTTSDACKDTFKALREKYIREREKQATIGSKYVPWQLMDQLKFLDPQIVSRKQSLSYEDDLQAAEEYKNIFQNDINCQSILELSNTDFDRSLIHLVKRATPIWDRRSNSYPSKQLKNQLWKTIAQTLNRDVSVCMLRWKGLREKYIRQRSKFHDGEGKWEFLEDMSFLDKVITYRRKHYDLNAHPAVILGNSDNENVNNDDVDYKNGFDNNKSIKNENFYDYENYDNSLDSGASSLSIVNRKRSASDYSDVSLNEKRDKTDEKGNPEQMFGDLVANMLAKKTERDKNIAMIEIMKILTKD